MDSARHPRSSSPQFTGEVRPVDGSPYQTALAILRAGGSGFAQTSHLVYLETDLDYYDAVLAAVVLAVGRDSQLHFAANEAVCGTGWLGNSGNVGLVIPLGLAAVPIFGGASDSLAWHTVCLAGTGMVWQQDTPVLAGTLGGRCAASSQTAPSLGF